MGRKKPEEVQFFGLDFLCYKFPSHPENDRADSTHPYIHTYTYTKIQLCNSGFLVCPFFLTVLIMFIYMSVL